MTRRAVGSVLLIKSDPADEHLIHSGRYADRALEYLSLNSEVWANICDWGDTASVKQVDVIVLFTHGCASRRTGIRCPQYCDPDEAGERACFRSVGGGVLATLRQAAERAAIGIYAATACFVGSAIESHLAGSGTEFIGYSADFRHVFVPVGEVNPFEDVVSAPFRTSGALESVRAWHMRIEYAYDKWIGIERTAFTEWQRENWWVVLHCLQHNRQHLLYHG